MTTLSPTPRLHSSTPAASPQRGARLPGEPARHSPLLWRQSRRGRWPDAVCTCDPLQRPRGWVRQHPRLSGWPAGRRGGQGLESTPRSCPRVPLPSALPSPTSQALWGAREVQRLPPHPLNTCTLPQAPTPPPFFALTPASPVWLRPPGPTPPRLPGADAPPRETPQPGAHPRPPQPYWLLRGQGAVGQQAPGSLKRGMGQGAKGRTCDT